MILYLHLLTSSRQAFEAPLLGDCKSNLSGGDIVKATGDIRVQYGVTRTASVDPNKSSTKNKIAFANPDVVEVPQKDSQFDV